MDSAPMGQAEGVVSGTRWPLSRFAFASVRGGFGNSPILVSLGVAAAVIALVAGRWAWHGRDWSAFIVAGNAFVAPQSTPTPIRLASETGYDGQFYYRLAIEPWTRTIAAHGVRLDVPAWRAQRIVYPTLAWLVSAGDARRVPVALVVVNVAAITLASLAIARLARDFGQSPSWGLIVLAAPGAMLGLARDLAEPSALLFVCCALLAAPMHQHLKLAVWLTLAALTRETTLCATLALAVAVVLAPNRWRFWRVLVSVAVAVVLTGVWQGIVWSWWSSAGASEGANLFSAPLAGAVDSWLTIWRTGSFRYRAIYVAYLAQYVAIAGLLVWTAIGRECGKDRADLVIRWTTVAAMVWFACGLFFTRDVWGDFWSFARVLGEGYFMACVALMTKSPPRGLAILLLSMAALNAVCVVFSP